MAFLALPFLAGILTVQARIFAQDSIPTSQPGSATSSGVKAVPDTRADQTVASGRISINVVVSDKLGHPVAGLQASDFTLLDNKQPQKLVGFRAIDHETLRTDPVHVVIVVDMINTGFDTVARADPETFEYLPGKGVRS